MSEVTIGGVVFKTNAVRIPVTREMLADFDPLRYGGFESRRDRGVFPRFVLIPTIDRIERAVFALKRGWRFLLVRLAGTYQVARHGLPEPEGEDW